MVYAVSSGSEDEVVFGVLGWGGGSRSDIGGLGGGRHAEVLAEAAKETQMQALGSN